MADKTKFIIVHSTKIAGTHIGKGEIIELDPDAKRDAMLIAQLNHAGRIALATPDLVKKIRQEVSDEDAAAAPVKRGKQAPAPEEKE